MAASRVNTVASAYICPGVSPKVKGSKTSAENSNAMRDHCRLRRKGLQRREQESSGILDVHYDRGHTSEHA